MATTPHDSLVKEGFDDPVRIAKYWRSILPESIEAKIDWPGIAPAPVEYRNKDLLRHQCDFLYSANLDGREAFLYLLLEHQSSADTDMPFRMLVYCVRIWEKFRKDHPNTPLPIILPAVLSHGASQSGGMPTTFFETLDPIVGELPEIQRYVPQFEFLLDDLDKVTDENLRARSLDVFSVLVLWALRDGRRNRRVLETFDGLGDLFDELLATQTGVEAFGMLCKYIAEVTGDLQFEEFCVKVKQLGQPAEQAMSTIAQQLEARGFEKGIEKGIQQGIEQGKSGANARTLGKLLAFKFGSITPDQRAKIDGSAMNQLEIYLERVLTANSAEEVLKD